jgi:hypothetical protein
MAYTPHARIVVKEKVEGYSREPTPEELEKLEHYREEYRRVFGDYPAGTHWIEQLRKFALLRRAGLPQDPDED